MPLAFVSGSFNVLHPGHFRLLRHAKECGGRLIVGVLSDKLAGAAAHVHESLRLEGVRSISWVDEAMLITDSIASEIERLRPDIVVKGKEHESRPNPEASILAAYGGKLIFSSGEATFSSLDLIRKEFSESDPRSIVLPQKYLDRHEIASARMIDLIRNFVNLKVCVIGDLIIDEYITCQALGMSQEDPTIVVTPIDTTRFVGGAGIVAAHAASLGAQVHFVSVSGNDATREYALEAISTSGVHAHILEDPSRPTTLKQRFRSQGKSLLRVSHLHQGAISSEQQRQLLGLLEDAMSGADLLVFSDFNYGCLPQALVDTVIGMAASRQIMLSADSQSSSQIGDVGRYHGMNLLTPTEREARIATRNHEDGLVILAEQLRQQSSAQNILLKLGEEGLMIHASNPDDGQWLTDRINALNSAPKDVAGAGDSLLITSSMALACGGDIWEAACLGSLAAAVQVGRVGNTPLRAFELEQEFG